jgi:hypothetical protein
MKATEFRALFEKFGKQHLSPIGFELHKGDWFYHDKRVHLALMACAGKWEMCFRVKRLTLALAHADVKTVDATQRVPFDNDLYHYAVHMAPSLLAPFVQSNFDTKLWHYSFIADRSSRKTWSDPIFYGGFGLPILKDPKAKRKEHDDQWREILAEDEIDYIPEEEAARRIERVFKQTRDNCLKWAAWCTHARVVSLLEAYRSNPPIWFEQKL